MEKKQELSSPPAKKKSTYDKIYRWILIIPLILLIFSVSYLYFFNKTNGDIIYKDVSLTGGTTVTIYNSQVNMNNLSASLVKSFPDINVNSISDIQSGGQVGVVVETKAGINQIEPALENYLGYNLTTQNSSVQFTGSEISEGFYEQLRSSIIAAFLLMACVVFLRFAQSKKIKSVVLMLTFLGVGIALAAVPGMKITCIIGVLASLIYGWWRGEKSKNKTYLLGGSALISVLILIIYPKAGLLVPLLVALSILYITDSMPSFMVVSCAFADIIMTIVVVDISKITLSLAGIIAFLMLIGYSVDTDILMTSRLLIEKEEEDTNKRLFGAFKTGIMMTSTAIAAVGVSLLIIQKLSDTLHQIFIIILIGLLFDIANTWITNASLLKWYVEARHLE